MLLLELTSAQSQQTEGVYEDRGAEGVRSSANWSEEEDFPPPDTPESQHCPGSLVPLWALWSRQRWMEELWRSKSEVNQR